MKKLLLTLACLPLTLVFSQSINISETGRFTDSRDGACEISAYDKDSKKLFITNAASDSIDIIDLTNTAAPTKIGGINVLTYGGGINSVVALNNGYIAAAIEATVKQDSGFVVFFDTAGNFVKSVKVGALPDMVTVTKDGNKVIVACEGEPSDDYLTDPKGSIGIIDISGGVTAITESNLTLLFFDNAPTTIAGSIRNPATSYSVDLEPEYIAVNSSSTKAAVVCQENNVLILVDLIGDSILSYKGLGFKDHSIAGNGMDVSNKDNKFQINTWPVKGVYQPDAISSYEVNGKTYWLSANEGDARDYSGFSSETRVKDLILDPTVFPNAAELQNDTNLGRLNTFTADVIGDIDADGDIDELYSYGSRSFSIWDSVGNLVWDSKDEIEQYMLANHTPFFNCNSGKQSKADSRSDDKGPEPEAITVGTIDGKTYAFLGLERQGGIMVYDITDPTAPVFDQYVHTMDTNTGLMIDIAPEGLVFVPASESHTTNNMLIVSNEVSGTTTVYELSSNSSVSIKDNELNEFNLYPNPTSGVLNFEGNFDTKIIRVIDITGKLMMNETGKVNSINLENLDNGVYFIQFIGENDQIVTKKVIKG